MQAKEELLEQLGESFGYVNELIDRKVEAYKLAIAEKSAIAASSIITGVILSGTAILAFIFALIALAFYLAGDMVGSAKGFGIVAIGLSIIFILIFIFRKTLITNPTLSQVVKLFFSDENKQS